MRSAPERPRRLSPGDLVAVVAPAGPVPRAAFETGAALLRDRYRLLHDEALFTRTGFLAGDDDRRLAELLAALQHPEVRAIICARGGHGALRLLPRLPLDLIAASQRTLVGFSDITALHAAWQRAGLASIHGPVVTHLGTLGPAAAADLFVALEDPAPPAPWTGLRPIAPGRAAGLAVGGNLEVLSRLVGTPYLPPLDGAVLFLEEIGERPYRLDRLLWHLQLAGALDRLAAVVVGDLVRCEEPDGTSEPLAAMAAVLSTLGCPVVAGAPFGHGDRNRAFPLGVRALVDGEVGTVTFEAGAVS